MSLFTLKKRKKEVGRGERKFLKGVVYKVLVYDLRSMIRPTILVPLFVLCVTDQKASQNTLFVLLFVTLYTPIHDV